MIESASGVCLVFGPDLSGPFPVTRQCNHGGAIASTPRRLPNGYTFGYLLLGWLQGDTQEDPLPLKCPLASPEYLPATPA